MCWRKGLDSMEKRMVAAMKNKILDISHDATFVVGNDKIEISCHKIFLVIASPVFEAMFSQRHNAQEPTTGLTAGECCKSIVIPDVHPDGLKGIIKYAYTGILNVDVNDATSTMYAAHKYDIPELCQHCSEVLPTKLSAENVVTVYQAAQLLNDENLGKDAWEFIEENAAPLLDSDQFLEFSGDNLRKFLSLDSMMGLKSEVDVFKALMRWGSFDCDQRDLNSTQENILRSVLEPYFPLIRFPAMDADEFIEVVAGSGVLSLKECNELYQYFLLSDTKRISMGTTLQYSSKSREGGKFVFSVEAINENLEIHPIGRLSHDQFTITGNGNTTMKLKSVGIVLSSKSTQSGKQCVSVCLQHGKNFRGPYTNTIAEVTNSLEICYVEFNPPVSLKLNEEYHLYVNIYNGLWVKESKKVELVTYSEELMNQSTFTWNSANNHELELQFTPDTYAIWALQLEN